MGCFKKKTCFVITSFKIPANICRNLTIKIIVNKCWDSETVINPPCQVSTHLSICSTSSEHNYSAILLNFNKAILNLAILILCPRHWNLGLLSSGASLTSWGKGASLALVVHLSSDGVTIKMPYEVDVLHRPASHPISSYWVG